MAQRINVQLNEKDVRTDLDFILADMDKIRTESIADGVSKQKNEYHALAYRLASCFKGLYSKDFDPNIKVIEDCITADEHLSSYDRLQAPYWSASRVGQEFLQNLAALTLAFFQPADFVQLFSQTGEYHLFQALNTLTGKGALPVQRGLPLERVLSTIPIEQASDTKVMAEAYQRCGYLTAEIKSGQAGNIALNLQRQGFDARPEGNIVIIKYCELPLPQFLQLAFGYQNIKRAAACYTAQTDQGRIILSPRGSTVSVLGENYFSQLAERDIEGMKLIEVGKDKKWAYLGDQGILFKHWFDQQLPAEAITIVSDMYKQHGEDIAAWLLDSTLPVSMLSDVAEEGLALLYPAQVRPTIALLTNAPRIASAVQNFTEFVRMYDSIKAVELPGQQTLWEMLDLLPEEAAAAGIETVIQAYLTHGNNLQGMIEAYQERRSTHRQLQSLLQSSLDYISTIGGKL